MRWALVAALSVTCLSRAAAADLAFHISEDVVEDEVAPRVARHVTHWEGDYYVSDASVTASGWGRKPAEVKAASFDTPVSTTNQWGSTVTTTYHRSEQGLDVRAEWGSFVVERHIVMTGPQSCAIAVSSMLKPGHGFFEIHRRSNLEPMFDLRRNYINVHCRPPALNS